MEEYEFPKDIKYSSSHEWIRMEGDVGVVGITDYAQHQLGDIVYVELPVVGDTIERDDIVGEIESVKAVDEIKMPISGEITAINEKIADSPELVNNSPFEDGWMVKIKPSNQSQIEELLSVEEYKEIVQKEEH